MKNNVMYSLFFIFLCSCNSENTNPKEEEYVSIVMNLNQTEIDFFMKNQLENYTKAFYSGDTETAIFYCYPDMFVWMKNEFPNDFNSNSVKDIFNEPILKLEKFSKEQNINYSFQIGDIHKRIDLDSVKIYTVVLNVVSKKGSKEIILSDEVIGVSNDYGFNWKFIQKDPESAPDILKMKFSNEIIDEIMMN